MDIYEEVALSVLRITERESCLHIMEAHVFVVINVIKKHGSFIPIFSINTNGVGFPYHESSIFVKEITS